MTGREIASGFQACQLAIDANLRDISQEESLQTPGPAGNCINWIAGHILVSRHELLNALGLDVYLDADESSRYASGSARMGPSSLAIELSDLHIGLQRTHEALVRRISALSLTDLDKEVSSELLPFPVPRPTIGVLIVLTMFHEAYHSGQLGLARRIVGKASGLAF